MRSLLATTSKETSAYNNKNRMDTVPNNHFRNYFTTLVDELLTQLTHCFSDCKSTEDTRKAFQTHIKGNQRHEDNMLKNWHKVMSPYYRTMVQDPVNTFEKILDILMNTAEKMEDITIDDLLAKIIVAKMTKSQKEYDKYENILYDPVFFLKQLKLREKWRDPTFDDDSRRYIVCYMLHLNGFAILYHIVPDELFEAAQTQGLKVMGNLEQSKNVKAGVDGETTQRLLKETYNVLPKDALNRFMQNMPMFMLSISCLSGAGLEEGNMLMKMLESSGPMAEQMGPMKNILNMVLPMLGNIPPEAFQNLNQMMQNGMIQNMLSGESGGLPNIDPNILQSMMRPDVLASMLQHLQHK